MEQATLLQAFVGFPIDFCMVALEQTAGNVEAAAGWALENFERYNSQALAASTEQVCNVFFHPHAYMQPLCTHHTYVHAQPFAGGYL